MTIKHCLAALCVGVALVTSGCAGVVKTSSGTSTIDSSYKLRGVRWDSGGALYIFIDVREKDGQTEVCGAWATEKGSIFADQFNNQVIQTVVLKGDGDTLAQGLGFMPEFSDPIEADGQTAKCVVTSRAWSPAYAENISIAVPPATYSD